MWYTVPMLKAIKSLFDYNVKQIAQLKKQLTSIHVYLDGVVKLTDAELPTEINKLRDQLSKRTKAIDEIMPYTYALVYEAVRRTLGFRAFDEQLIAAIALNQSKVVEQKTGEGKTLTATFPLVLNALTGKGAHLVTVNDYLARRDAGWMGQVYAFLGLRTAVIISGESYIVDPDYTSEDNIDWRLGHLRPCTRKEAYDADITYGINSEFGFDYLRDNMAQSGANLVQKYFHYAIIDEADSILIDEARTPHIISAPYEEDTSRYYRYATIVKQLKQEEYIIDEKLKTVHLTDEGIQHIEQIIGVDNIYEKDFESLFHIEAALRARTLYHKDKDYIVRNNEVVIVDEFTGRLLHGRRFSEGLHQALEAKENVLIQKESRTLATVSLQNYFRMYEKLAGMTGTAVTEAQEFHKIYKCDVVAIPTHRPMARKDNPDVIYKTAQAKYNAVADEIVKHHAQGRPILIGTTSISKNENLSELLTKRGVKHELLNAKNHEREAHIIAAAGKKGAVTVATNMAGRGVDIVLGGQQPARDDYKDEKDFKKAKEQWQKEHDAVIDAGGLYVIGTERHESRRIDNQLRGRSGRQGDPGDTCFFVSLEDDLMRIFGGEQISKMMNFLNFPEDQPLSHGMVSKAIEQAQIKVEGFNFDIRKHLVEYDDVLSKQRDIVYSLRKRILKLPEENPETFRKTVFDVFREEINSMLTAIGTIQDEATDEEIELITHDLTMLFHSKKDLIIQHARQATIEELYDVLMTRVEEYFADRERGLGPDVWHGFVRHAFLRSIDQHWTEHLTAIENLREGINLRGYAQIDPLIAYKNEAFSMFEQLIHNIYTEAMRRVLKEAQDQINKQQETLQDHLGTMQFQSASGINPFRAPSQSADGGKVAQKTPARSPTGPKIGRNDPCWCGSGKKYKHCHYPN